MERRPGRLRSEWERPGNVPLLSCQALSSWDFRLTCPFGGLFNVFRSPPPRGPKK